MSLGNLQELGDLERWIQKHFQRPEVRKSITLAATTVEAIASPTFATGWSNIGGSYHDAGYYKDRDRVYLRGNVTNGGTGAGEILTLPEGYRPAAQVIFRVATASNSSASVVIPTNGIVTDATFDANSKTRLSLDGISFRVS